MEKQMQSPAQEAPWTTEQLVAYVNNNSEEFILQISMEEVANEQTV